MDAYHHHHQQQGYMRPPPPPPLPPQSAADPNYYHHYQQQPRPPLPPSQPQGTSTSWYSNQFQYHPPQPSSHSPSPPPPPHHWAPPPPPSSYPPPPPPPPQSHHPYPTHFSPHPSPRPQQPYPQEWGNPNWGHHQHQQAWDYSAQNNVEDWAARARAWAAAKNAMEDQHPQSQFTPTGRAEEQSQYYDQYPLAADTHYQGVQQQHYPATVYQQFPVSASPSHQPPVAYQQENASFNTGQSTYVSDGSLPYNVGGGTTTASPSVHQQEVPSSYSSVTGKEETAGQREQLYNSLSSPISSVQGQHHLQPSFPATGRSATEQPFAYTNQAADGATDPSNQPLEFAPGFNRDHDPHMQSSYVSHHDSAGIVRSIAPVASVPSISSWAPAVTSSAVYTSPILPTGPQDPTIPVPSSVSGHAVPPFGNFPGSSLQPTISPGGVPYGLGAGNTLHPTSGFTGDVYGVSNVSERPKKASVPNWLKEEIIKNAITKSSVDHPREEMQSTEDESVGKGDQANSERTDSPRLTEEEDDDEDYAEAARTLAINQEIKRVLTEVLLKVTDELFDEIATKVLDDDEFEQKPLASNHNVSPSHTAVPTPKASAKVVVPGKTRESENDISEKSSSSSPGNVLGLANYASDDDDDEIPSSSLSNSQKNPMLQQPAISQFAEDKHGAAENGILQAKGENTDETNLESDLNKTSSIQSNNEINGAITESSEHVHSKVVSGARGAEIRFNSEKTLESNTGAASAALIGENIKMKSEPFGAQVSTKRSLVDDSYNRDTRMKSDKDSRHESKRSYSGKDVIKEAEIGSRVDEMEDDGHRKQDGKHLSKEKTDDLNGSKEKKKEHTDKTGERAKESESRRRSSHFDVKEDRKEADKLHGPNAKEDSNKRRERTKDNEEDRGRHKPTSGSSKHKRRRSSSISSRGRNSKDNDSSDESSDDSKRKLHSRKRRTSPSPVRSKRRQVSRSPHSKRSERRHSPYSSLETSRRRRSRSKSPVRRHR